MKLTTTLTALGLLGLSLLQPAEAADPSAIQPVLEIRTLARVQNGLTTGQMSGLRVQHVVIRSIGHKFLSASPEIWSEPQNADAAIRFLLSGGNPAFGRIRAVQDAIPKSRQHIFAASMAFAEGGRSKARQLLKGVDPRKLPPMIAGHVALVAGILLSRRDPGAAQEFLEDARLLGSGTLVEEAALRRQLSVAVALGEFSSFQRLADTYVRHYRNSVYLGVFRERFTQNVLAVLETGNKTRIKWLIDHLKSYKDEERIVYAALIAREATLRGRPEIVEALVEFGLGGATVPASTSTQLALYKSATSIVGKNSEEGAKLYSLVDVEQLEGSDVAIHHAAGFLLGRIQDWPDTKAPGEEPTARVARPALEQAEGSRSVAMILESGRAKLAAATSLLAQ